MERLSDRPVSILPKGTSYTRYLKLLAITKGNRVWAAEMARHHYPGMPEIETALKAAVTAGTTSDSTWAGPLSVTNTMASEFLELLRPATILGKLSGLRRIPFNIRMARAIVGSTVRWVGQGMPAPLTRMSFDSPTPPMPPTKLSSILVLSDELMKVNTTDAEAVVRRDMIAAIAQYSDQQFINPAITAVADLNPASITNGVTPRNSTGATGAAIIADTGFVMSAAINANLTLQNGYWIMNPRTALALSQIRETGTEQLFEDITVKGGEFQGLPVIVSASVPIDTAGHTIIVLVDAAEIFYAEEGLEIDVSNEASLQMDSAPSAGATNEVSLWQENFTAFKSDQFVGWSRRRAEAVQVIDGVAY